MKILTVMFLLIAATSAATARAESRAKLDGDFTIDWQQTIFSTEQPVPVMSIGQTPIAVRPLPRDKKDKPKDPPRAALFVGDTIRSKTLIYPGKPYHLTLVSRDGKAHLFVNGFPDAEPAAAKLSGAVDSERDDIRISRGARAADEILADFKKKLPAGDVVVVAHRGVHKHAPENTRISYVQAVEAKAPIVEFDTALTKDGHIVGMHDKTVDRTTDGTGAVADMTLQQVRKLDAGSWKHPKYKGEPVPTIDDIADVVRGKAILMLDLKAEGQGKAIAQWLEKSKFPRDQLMLAPWEDAEGVALRRYVKDVPMIRLTSKVPTQTVDDAYFVKMKQTGFSGFSVNWNNLTQQFTDAARKNGMKVYVWTINDNPEIAGAMLIGVDGIITDDSAATAKTLRKLRTKG